MEVTKGLKIGNWLLFFYLCIFPLGQLLRFRNILLLDIIILFFIPVLFSGKIIKPKIFKYFIKFFIYSIFSGVLAIFIFNISDFKGLLYFVRMLSYVAYLIVIFNLIRYKVLKKKILFQSFLLLSVVIAIGGWIQYFYYPDLRALYSYGWDDHLYRLTSTFLDPGFTGILLVFGFLGFFTNYKNTHDKRLLIFLAFLFLSILLTYSRASYIALLFGVIYLTNNKLKWFVLMLFLLIVGIYFIPRQLGEGVKLDRTTSIEKRINNYKETINISQKSPLFGVGFNNICFFKDTRYIHSCFGSDSSLLFLLATTGLGGIIIFAELVVKMTKVSGVYGQTFMASSLALFVHSLFVNSLFYPWVLGWIFGLYALSIKE